MLNVIMLNDVMLNVIMLNVIMLSCVGLPTYTLKYGILRISTQVDTYLTGLKMVVPR
jgi:hypothetical protein